MLTFVERAASRAHARRRRSGGVRSGPAGVVVRAEMCGHPPSGASANCSLIVPCEPRSGDVNSLFVPAAIGAVDGADAATIRIAERRGRVAYLCFAGTCAGHAQVGSGACRQVRTLTPGWPRAVMSGGARPTPGLRHRFDRRPRPHAVAPRLNSAVPALPTPTSYFPPFTGLSLSRHVCYQFGSLKIAVKVDRKRIVGCC